MKQFCHPPDHKQDWAEIGFHKNKCIASLILHQKRSKMAEGKKIIDICTDN